MNCDQFDNRMQLLLDKRVPLSTDSELTCHAQLCDSCASLLPVYQAIADHRPKCAIPGSADVDLVADALHAPDAHGSLKPLPTKRSAALYPILALATCIAGLAIGINLWAPPRMPADRHAVLIPDNSDSAAPRSPLSNADDPAEQRRYRKIKFDWISDQLSYGLDSASQIDITQVGDVNLSSFFPSENVRVIQGLPNQIASVAPRVYEYSMDIPRLSSWSYRFQQIIQFFWTSK